MLLDGAKNEERKRAIVSGYQRLVDPAMMGKTYKFLAVASSKEIPIGFEEWAAEERKSKEST